MVTKPKIVTITTLKAPLKNTLSFVRYHLNSGIDHMYLFFDDPNDKAISHLKDNNRCSCQRCDNAYWLARGIDQNAKIQIKQRINATLAFQLAQDAGMDWIIHLDSDELLYSPKSFNEIFSNISPQADVIRFPPLEAAPQQLNFNNPFKDINHFKVHLGLGTNYNDFTIDLQNKRKQLRRAKFWYRRKKLCRIIFNIENDGKENFLLGHTVGKSATKTSANIKYVGNHLPVPVNNHQLHIHISQKAFLLHYDCQGYEAWKAKWKARLNGSANFDHTRFTDQRNNLMRSFAEASKRGEKELSSLYRNLYYLSNYEKTIFYLSGLLKKINIDEELFSHL